MHYWSTGNQFVISSKNVNPTTLHPNGKKPLPIQTIPELKYVLLNVWLNDWSELIGVSLNTAVAWYQEMVKMPTVSSSIATLLFEFSTFHNNKKWKIRQNESISIEFQTYLKLETLETTNRILYSVPQPSPSIRQCAFICLTYVLLELFFFSSLLFASSSSCMGS